MFASFRGTVALANPCDRLASSAKCAHLATAATAFVDWRLAVRPSQHHRGAPQDVEPTLDGASCTIVLDLALGEGSASYLTSDLSYDYVRINAEYRS